MIRAVLIASLVLAAAPAAAETYGALYYSFGKNKYGSAWNQPSVAKAEAIALENCKKAGGTQCTLTLSLENSCGAYASAVSDRKLSRSGHSFGFQNHDAAKARAMKECQSASNGDQCFVVRSVCSIGK